MRHHKPREIRVEVMPKVNSNLLKCGNVQLRHTSSLNSALQWHIAIWLWLKCFSTCPSRPDYPDKYNIFSYSLLLPPLQQACAPGSDTSTNFAAYQEKRYMSWACYICDGSPRLSPVSEIVSLLPPGPQALGEELHPASGQRSLLLRRREGFPSRLVYRCNRHPRIYFTSSLKPRF